MNHLARRVLGLVGLLVCLLVVGFGVVGVSSAFGVESGAVGLLVEARALPSRFAVKDNADAGCDVGESFRGCDSFVVVVRDGGSVASSGVVSLSDTVPVGVSEREVELVWPAVAEAFGETGSSKEANVLGFLREANELFPGAAECGVSGSPATFSCVVDPEFVGLVAQFKGLCSGSLCAVAVNPDEEMRLSVRVTVDEPAPSGALVDEAEVSGGGSASEKAQAVSEVGAPPSFGFSHFDFDAAAANGEVDTQAGDHPYELTTTIGVNSEFRYWSGW